MTCPPEIASIIADILQHGTLQIRSRAWSSDFRFIGELADHIHNLPALLTDFAPERLAYYWEVERVSFVDSVEKELSTPYAVFWNRLEEFVVASDSESPVEASTEQA